MKIKRTILLLFAAFLVANLTGCSSDSKTESSGYQYGDHVDNCASFECLQRSCSMFGYSFQIFLGAPAATDTYSSDELAGMGVKGVYYAGECKPNGESYPFPNRIMDGTGVDPPK